MVDDIHNTCKIFAHICFHIVRSGKKLRNTVVQVGCDNLVNPAFLIVSVKFIHTFCKQTVSSADEYTVGVTFFDLFGNVKHTFSRRNHVVDDNNVFTFYRVAKELMSYDGVLAIYHCGIITSLIEHAHINAQNIGKIYGSGHSTLIRTDDHEMIIVNLEIVNVLYQSFQELIGWEKVVKTI